MLKQIKFKIVYIIIISAILFGFVFNAISEFGIPVIRPPKIINYLEDSTLEMILDEPSENDQVSSVNLEQFYDLYNIGNIKIVDARDKWDYSDNHIKGAINIPEYMFEDDHKNLELLDTSDIIIVYCGDINCDISKKLAHKLLLKGYRKTFIFADGWQSWLEADYPVEGGSENE